MENSSPGNRELTVSHAERIFERALWNCRLVVLVAVLGAMVGAMSMFFITTMEILYVVKSIFTCLYNKPAKGYDAFRSSVVTRLVEGIDGYLLATMLIIFAYGLYELFISRIDPAIKTEQASNVLLIRSFDDLKDRLAKVVLLLLIVKFFEYAVPVSYEHPTDLLQLAGAIALVALALYLNHHQPSHSVPEVSAGASAKDKPSEDPPLHGG